MSRVRRPIHRHLGFSAIPGEASRSAIRARIASVYVPSMFPEGSCPSAPVRASVLVAGGTDCSERDGAPCSGGHHTEHRACAFPKVFFYALYVYPSFLHRRVFFYFVIFVLVY